MLYCNGRPNWFLRSPCSIRNKWLHDCASPVVTHLAEPEVMALGKRIGLLLLARVTAVKCVAKDTVVTWC